VFEENSVKGRQGNHLLIVTPSIVFEKLPFQNVSTLTAVSFAAVFWDVTFWVEHCVTSQKTAAMETTLTAKRAFSNPCGFKSAFLKSSIS